MKISPKRVRIIKIKNRRGYAAICLNHLTEGPTAQEAYRRMIKALRRRAVSLEDLGAAGVKRLIVSL